MKLSHSLTFWFPIVLFQRTTFYRKGRRRWPTPSRPTKRFTRFLSIVCTFVDILCSYYIYIPIYILFFTKFPVFPKSSNGIRFLFRIFLLLIYVIDMDVLHFFPSRADSCTVKNFVPIIGLYRRQRHWTTGRGGDCWRTHDQRNTSHYSPLAYAHQFLFLHKVSLYFLLLSKFLLLRNRKNWVQDHWFNWLRVMYCPPRNFFRLTPSFFHLVFDNNDVSRCFHQRRFQRIFDLFSPFM